MKDLECTEFMQRHLSRLRLRWAGFRKVRRQVCKRLSRRFMELGVSGLPGYESYLDDHPEEWQVLDSIFQITISRFYRDRAIFDVLCSRILPSMAKDVASAGRSEVTCWCAGCCSGEEAYTLQILWKTCVVPSLECDLPLRIIATDINRTLLIRAREARYPARSLRDLPKELVHKVFRQSGAFFTLNESYRENIEFREEDIRVRFPEGSFHLILCRNLVLTYFEETLQRGIIQGLLEKLIPGGVLVVGIHESLPEGLTNVIPYDHIRGIYQRRGVP